MGKERLEEIIKLLEDRAVIDRSDYEWLIEQTEQKQSLETAVDFYQSALRDADRRVQELKELLTQIKYDKEAHIALSEKYLKKQLQNKRYREALEYIGNHVNDSEWMSNVVDTKLIKAIIREALEELK